ncbi:acyl-CoA carboxylase subunit epsilon [Corynebacterium epidermidicanis]|uniref:Acyl-CoA carboxylase epsilon subunit n=1 Tax=Corynebacterium epidermidicanis TaxID=1050174 RepID=A0A0G3GUB3_9CORY|nr:acyl-CoA carboxylase subunit epsilon [Corynebacterium epidermidicanis]AKK02472.1 Acyl-CoA carboxylase epsilon subunit [Corynebacterium epidermidicanis]
MEDKKPFLKVLKGNPTDAQVAALTVLFASMSGGEPEKPKPTNRWGSIAERLRRPTMYNPNAFHNVSFY